jgi:type IV pilus assembly protein PilF
MRTLMLAALAAAVVWLAGCATQPPQGPDYGVQGDESPAEQRARAHSDLGVNYFQVGSNAVALQELQQAVQIDPNYGPAYNGLGLVYMKLNQNSKAESAFKQALSINPNDSEANNNYGWFLCQTGRAAESVRYFVTALKNPLYKTPYKAYINAGVCSKKSGDLASAQDFFLQALRYRPSQPDALYNLADIFYTHGNYGQAKSYLDRYDRLARPTAASLWLGARIARRLGNNVSEAQYANALRQNFPGSDEAKALMSGQFQ